MSVVVWFRRDLRLTDNPAWSAACATGEEVQAVFVVDPKLMGAAGPHRGPQLLAHLRELDRSLDRLGGRLHVATGPAKEALADMNADTVFANRDVSPYAIRRDRDVDADWHDGCYVVPPGSILTGEGEAYKVFTPFYRKWQQTPWPEWPEAVDPVRLGRSPGIGIPEAASPLVPGGELAALERLDRFDALVDGYLDDRNRPDLDHTSRLSPDLKFGTLSPRQVIDRIGSHTPGREAFVRQLAWREFYAQVLLSAPHTARAPLRPEYAAIPWNADPDHWQAWCDGRTGYPLVDAGMRQLAAEGWMHNRVRLVAASFLVKDLLIDWRRGERFFFRLLLDGDPAQNIGNWQWVAGTGADAAPYFRIFNPTSQAKKFDPDGTYIRRWVPELAKVPTPHIHAPWEAPPLELAAAGVTLGDDYPPPIVDHAAARVRTLAAYEAARA